MPTFETVRLHEFVEKVCRHCGGRETTGVATETMTCVPRQREAMPRQRPMSFDALPWEIGDRMKEIMDEEARALAGAAETTAFVSRETTPDDYVDMA